MFDEAILQWSTCTHVFNTNPLAPKVFIIYIYTTDCIVIIFRYTLVIGLIEIYNIGILFFLFIHNKKRCCIQFFDRIILITPKYKAYEVRFNNNVASLKFK